MTQVQINAEQNAQFYIFFNTRNEEDNQKVNKFLKKHNLVASLLNGERVVWIDSVPLQTGESELLQDNTYELSEVSDVVEHFTNWAHQKSEGEENSEGEYLIDCYFNIGDKVAA